MKKLTACCCFAILTFGAIAQVQRQTDTTYYKALISADRVKLLQNMDVIANMQFAMNNYFTDGKYDKSTYTMNQFRFEMKGKVHEKVYYRFRNRYTRAQDPQSIDKISNSVDMAFIRVDATPKWNFTFGKMCADWGGYEFDLNPIDIYEYNDIVEYADNFLSGIQAQFVATNQHIFTAQILNSRTKTYKELYDSIPGVTEARFPAALVLNWRGNFGNGKFTTLWSYSRFIEAKNKSMFYLALGNMYNFKKGS
ncbi:MAG TPA: porin, partial [Phnomibacter sp.]|nr:porin [Phnomibacter sp.]